uniref:C2 domain-containing protein n=1 Tax=Chromera velia CCMP2878 TaxID=1169474 RepID=A0A0G4HYQ8_9ALVE|eukprot:Cvel_9537.t1-p1 / transcript=Cvel_9537.t1 / gene=Cvel_9537 / organism=Chromera_velia_CCMP2878 / gene_product=hypothetical protein / transcript_product=hypothetical protein / location=Cvel_scaffold552:42560-57077(+) / protein_length=1163 / sequence_SO=supercontig / SO=protein_coding / is_pseudo=false
MNALSNAMALGSLKGKIQQGADAVVSKTKKKKKSSKKSKQDKNESEGSSSESEAESNGHQDNEETAEDASASAQESAKASTEPPEEPENVTEDTRDLVISEAEYEKRRKRLAKEYSKERGDTEAEKRTWRTPRRFKFHLSGLRLENLSKDENVCAWIDMMFGGTRTEFRVRDNKGTERAIADGTFGTVIRTHHAEIAAGEVTEFSTQAEGEWRGNYMDLEREKFQIDIWSVVSNGVNRLKAQYESSLYPFATGRLAQSFVMERVVGKKRTDAFRISFQLLFQEIFDFELELSEWKLSGLIPLDGAKEVAEGRAAGEDDDDDDLEAMDATPLSRGPRGLSPRSPAPAAAAQGQAGNPFSITSPLVQNISTDPKLIVRIPLQVRRGTASDLENVKLEYRVLDEDSTNAKERIWSLFSTPSNIIAEGSIELRGVLEYGYVSSELKPPKWAIALAQSTGPSAERALTSMNFGKIEGKIFASNRPKYHQFGNVCEIEKGHCYLMIKIIKIDKLVTPDERETADSFVEIMYDGVAAKTRPVVDSLEPQYHQDLTFEIKVRDVSTPSAAEINEREMVEKKAWDRKKKKEEPYLARSFQVQANDQRGRTHWLPQFLCELRPPRQLERPNAIYSFVRVVFWDTAKGEVYELPDRFADHDRFLIYMSSFVDSDSNSAANKQRRQSEFRRRRKLMKDIQSRAAGGDGRRATFIPGMAPGEDPESAMRKPVEFEETPKLPYRTIEVVFNNRNCWANRQHQSLSLNNANKPTSSFLQGDLRGDDSLGPGLPVLPEDGHPKLVAFLEKGLGLVEELETCASDDAEIAAATLRDWRKVLYSHTPRNHRLRGGPMSFAFSDPRTVAKAVVENFPFLDIREKTAQFALAVRVSPLPNQVVSVYVYLVVIQALKDAEGGDDEGEAEEGESDSGSGGQPGTDREGSAPSWGILTEHSDTDKEKKEKTEKQVRLPESSALQDVAVLPDGFDGEKKKKKEKKKKDRKDKDKKDKDQPAAAAAVAASSETKDEEEEDIDFIALERAKAQQRRSTINKGPRQSIFDKGRRSSYSEMMKAPEGAEFSDAESETQSERRSRRRSTRKKNAEEGGEEKDESGDSKREGKKKKKDKKKDREGEGSETKRDKSRKRDKDKDKERDEQSDRQADADMAASEAKWGSQWGPDD